MKRKMELRSKVLVGVALGVFAAGCVADRNEPRATTQSLTLGDDCSHGICATGIALVSSCDPCATALCAKDPYCCSTAWDTTCVGEVTAICGQSCTAPPPVPSDAGASTCGHPICATGPALVSTCDPCTTALCIQDPYCCTTAWDATCVGEVTAICGASCK